MAGETWSTREVDLTIEAYFSMLRLELDGEEYSKAEFRRELRKQIQRSDGSVEYKLQNVSAVLADLGGAFIDGYKPARNVQGLLRERVTYHFTEATDLHSQMVRAADEAPPAGEVELGDPVPLPRVARATPPPGRKRVGRVVDFQQREAANRALGLAGEEAVVRREQRKLAAYGQERLAERVRHVSVLDGDGLGYDVLSFTPDGKERYIEVKTTRYSRELPFFVSRNEVQFSVEEPDHFCLYRLFGFGKPQGGHYELPGSLTATADLRPEVFTGLPSSASA